MHKGGRHLGPVFNNSVWSDKSEDTYGDLFLKLSLAITRLPSDLSPGWIDDEFSPLPHTALGDPLPTEVSEKSINERCTARATTAGPLTLRMGISNSPDLAKKDSLRLGTVNSPLTIRTLLGLLH